jgi:heat shock protein HslJ
LMFLALLSSCTKAGQAQPPAQNTELSGTEWVLTSLNGTSPIEDKEISLRFGEENIDGSGGCNTYGGSYSASGENLSLNDVYWTEMACMEPEGIMEQEQDYFQVLNAAVSYRLEGDRLVLYDKAGTQVLEFAAPTSVTSSVEEVPVDTSSSLSLGCTLEMDETYPAGEPVTLRFALHNQTDRPVYVLSWYTPLEGIAGDIFEVTRDGEELRYQGKLAKRGDPDQEAYITIEPGKSASAEVDLSTGYDLTAPDTYEVQFTPGLRDITADASLLPREQDDYQRQPLSCNTVSFQIVPEPDPATATPIPEPKAGFKQYIDTDSGVSLWVPEDWTIVQSGLQTGLPDGTTRLQSYPEDKYIGGEPSEPGDTKCDLTIHPPEASITDVIAKIKSDPLSTILSEEEIFLQSGLSGTRMERESMGTALSLITEVNELVITLTCHGESELFDEIASTIGISE